MFKKIDGADRVQCAGPCSFAQCCERMSLRRSPDGQGVIFQQAEQRGLLLGSLPNIAAGGPEQVAEQPANGFLGRGWRAALSRPVAAGLSVAVAASLAAAAALVARARSARSWTAAATAVPSTSATADPME